MRILAFFNLTKKLLFCIIIEIFIFLVKQIFKEAFMEKVDTKQEFLELFQQNIHRDGAKELLDWLVKTDFFTAPASTRFHSNYEGGLCIHSINVYKRLKKLVDTEYGDKRSEVISDESIAVIGLLHDICKVNNYKQEVRNTKVDGAWVQKPVYTVDDKLPFGHGEKSVYMISGFMKLSREEAMAINWHMGGFDARVIGGASWMMSEAYYQYPIATLCHIADFMATYLDEKPVE